MFDVITIGTATRDAFIKSKNFKIIETSDFPTGRGICVPAGSKLDVDNMYFATGGGATNMATTFSRQGLRAACICKIGEDISGREIVLDLQREKIDTRFIMTDKAEKTAYSVLLLAEKGERTIFVFRGASEKLAVRDVNWRTIQAKWFYLSGALPSSVMKEVLDLAQDTGAKVAFNPSSKHIKTGLAGIGEMLEKVDVIIINREEGAKLTGISYDDEQGIFNKLDEHIKGIAVMTEGSKGVLVSDNNKIYKSGVFKEDEVLDKTGAGDAFGSGLITGLLNEPDLESVPQDRMFEAIRLASANAASVVEKIGAKTGIITKKEFEENNRWRELDVKVE